MIEEMSAIASEMTRKAMELQEREEKLVLMSLKFFFD